MQNCCFCINLRTATLLLAISGALSHLYGGLTLLSVSDSLDADIGTVTGLTFYLFLSAFACFAGFFGVIKNNPEQLRLFSIFYWTDLALHTTFAIASTAVMFTVRTELCKELIDEMNDPEFDMETCKEVYIAGAWLVAAAMTINMVMKLHFALAIHTHASRVKKQCDDEQTRFEFIVEAPPAYVYSAMPVAEEKKQEPVFVAGQEYVPDAKK